MTSELELRDLAATLRRGWGRIAWLGGLGLAVGMGFAFLVPPRFDGEVMLLVRTPQDASGALAEQLGPLAGLAGGALGFGQNSSQIATEVALLQSRSLVGEVIDSLGLQRRAGRRPPASLASVELPGGRFRPRRLTANGVRIQIVDRDDAIDDALRRFEVRELGGEVLAVRFRARDSVSAAAFPNLLARRYLVRRATVDRGLNQRKYEFLVAQADSARVALQTTLAELRRLQQSRGVLAVDLSGRAEAEQMAVLQGQLSSVRGEVLALDSLLRTVRSGGEARALAGFPSLLKSPAVNELVGEMARLQTERIRLLVTQRDQTPMVRALAAARDSLEAQLLPLARTYGAALERQQRALLDELEMRRRAQNGIADAGEVLVYLETRAKGLSQAVLALETQVLEARLAALTEGGDVRVVDPAVAPRKVAFPRLSLSAAAGTIFGLLLGVLWGLAPLAHRADISRSAT